MGRWVQRWLPWLPPLGLPLLVLGSAARSQPRSAEQTIEPVRSGAAAATARALGRDLDRGVEASILAHAPDLRSAHNAAELTTRTAANLDPCEVAELPHAPPSTVAERFYGDTHRPIVALTFDDGPSSENTPGILRTLDRLGVRATFFVLGHRAEAMPELLQAIAADGHELANHGWTHTSLRSLWRSQIRDELCRTSDAIESATGLRPALFRPPFGRYPPSAVPLVGGLGMHFVLWSVDAHDWELDDPDAVAARVVEAAQPGSIILLHDRESVTRRALPEIVSGLRRRGFELTTVSEATGLAAYVH